MVGCGVHRQGPSNLIKKISDSECEVRFYVEPPANAIHVEPYLYNNSAELHRQTTNSGKVFHNRNYKISISTFCKYFKSNIEGTPLIWWLIPQNS